MDYNSSSNTLKVIFYIMDNTDTELANNLSIESEAKTKGKFLNKLVFFGLLSSIFLIPLIFIPSQSVNFVFTKQVLFSTVIFVAFLFWLFLRLKEGRYELPISPIIFALGGVVLVTILSSLFSGVIRQSFFGTGFEVGTAISILVGFLAVFLIPLYFTNKDRIFLGYVMFFSAFAVLSLFEIIRLCFGPDVLSFGFFTDTTSNMIGSWNDMGVFFGLTTLLALVTIEFFPTGKLIKFLSFASMFVSLCLLAFINLSMIWLALGLFSTVLFVYLFSFSKKHSINEPELEDGMEESIEEEKIVSSRRFPTATLIVVVISILFIIGGGYINNWLSTKFNISQIDVRPSWQATVSVAKETLKIHPLFGAGPNQFFTEWLKYKDPAINSTMFWNSNFIYGIGLIPTYVINTGLLGAVAWLAFFIFLLYAGFRAIFLPSKDRFLRYLTISSFLGSFFLWIFNVFYAPGNVMVALTFIFTGLFISALVKEGLIKIKTGLYTENAKSSFISVLILISLLVGVFGLGYGIIERYFAYLSYQKGLVALNMNGNVDSAEANFFKAASLSQNDVFYRALTEIGIIRMSNLLNSASKDTPASTLQSQFQNILGTTLNYATEAININNGNYQNWVERGRVYEAVMPLKIDGSYEAAANAYEQATKYAPLDPSIYLMLARLEYTRGDNAKAKEFITKALNLKQNYTDAIFLLAQIQIKEGDSVEAIKSVSAASILSPNDPTIFFQLGLLQFNTKDYKGAVASLEKSIALSPQYANAKYYLGLAYEKLGREKDAIAQFTDLKKTNPDNKEIDSILQNLKDGNAPLSSSSSLDKRTTPPINEKSASSE